MLSIACLEILRQMNVYRKEINASYTEKPESVLSYQHLSNNIVRYLLCFYNAMRFRVLQSIGSAAREYGELLCLKKCLLMPPIPRRPELL